MNNRIVISGCSGGGKSSLLDSLESRGYKTVQEAGRRVVAAEVKLGSEALPWKNMLLFLERAIDLASEDFEKVSQDNGPVFFDRSLVDLILAYEHYTDDVKYNNRLETTRYAERVFFTPPWPEIYVRDSERQHSLGEAVNEYRRLEIGYPKLGYDIHVLPKSSVEVRTNVIVDRLGLR